MSKRNFELDKLLWPKDSLNKALEKNFPGCNTAAEALKKAIEIRNQIPPPAPVKKPAPPELLQSVIEELEEKQSSVDVDSLPLDTRARLAKMPLTSSEDVLLWREAWIKEIELLKW